MTTPDRWHILTGEFPPQPGGVSDYTYTVVDRLAAAGGSVTVWAPPASGPDTPPAGVNVRRLPDLWRPWSLAQVGRAIGRRDRILVQYVPHAFGLRAMNLPLCLWLTWQRVGRRRAVDVMMHEFAVQFVPGLRRANLMAIAHRLMAGVVLTAADRVWVSIPAIGRLAERYSLRQVRPQWLPVFSTVPVVLPAAPPVVGRFGTFGTYSPSFDAVHHAAFAEVLATGPATELLLIGRGGCEYRSRLIAAHPHLVGLVRATGGLPPAAVAAAMHTCQLMVQPYPDGVSSRRTSTMAALANGVAVVTNAGVNTEPDWSDGAVRLVTGEPGSWAHAVTELCDRLAAVALGSVGQRLYAARFAPERIVTAILADD